MSTPATLDDDARLLEGLRAGDEAAFRQLVDAYGPMLLRLAMMHVPSRAVAEEVLQDTWLAVLNGIDRFEGRSSLKTWITSILLNTARTRGERERRTLPFSLLRGRDPDGRDEPAVPPSRFQGRRGEQPGAWARPPVDWGPPEERLSSDAARQVLLEAIAALPPSAARCDRFAGHQRLVRGGGPQRPRPLRDQSTSTPASREVKGESCT